MNSKLFKLCEVVADIAYQAGVDRRYSGDSRADIQRFIDLAEEFEKLHENTDWNEHGDYIGAVDEFARQKLADMPVSGAALPRKV